MRLVYLSPVPWDSFAQRPHKFVEWFQCKYGAKVIWVDPYPTRLPILEDFRRVKGTREGQGQSRVNENDPEWLSVIRPRALPIEPLPGVGVLNALFWKDIFEAIDTFVKEDECLLAIGKPSELAVQLLIRHANIPSLYDAMDDFPAFYQGISRIAMNRRERTVACRVSRILVSSTLLADQFAIYGTKVSLVHNACAVDNFPPVHTLTKNTSRCILGYVGTIGKWFDWPLVVALAKSNPTMCIRLIGPIYTLPTGQLPPNIELLPACNHSTAIKAMQKFSVGLIPFKRTELTASVDPIKYYEYKALGLPVISSRFGEMVLREGLPGVFLATGHSGLSNNFVRCVLVYKGNISEMQEFRSANSWEARFEGIAIFN